MYIYIFVYFTAIHYHDSKLALPAKLKDRVEESQITSWQRCIGCLNLQVSFRKRATNHRAHLRKTICKEKEPPSL